MRIPTIIRKKLFPWFNIKPSKLIHKENVKHLEGRINNQIFGVKELSGANPAMEDGEVDRKVCFTHKSIGCCYRSD